ncbi:DUF3108 domain-containing protein [Kordiimonas sp.]|uniref:DUF3108 domain-containing protein n=1 Tax=Kordiimonas sp. TaxID=1970157 RepID=UPI003A93142F
MTAFIIRTLASLIAIISMAANATAERVEATYNFIWNGFVVFTAEAVLEQSSASYAINMNVRTRGVMRLFNRGEGDLSAVGTIGPDGQIVARHYVSKGRWSGDDYRKELFFDETGKFIRWERDWPDEWLEDYERAAVPEIMQYGPDGLSFLMLLLTESPPAATRVFDGDHVMEIRLACARGSELKDSRHSPIKGAATKCQFESETVAGELIETEEQQQKRLKEEEKARKKAERYARRHQGEDEDAEEDEAGIPIWLQQIEELGYTLPVRASFKSDWGTIRMYLKELKTSDGVHLKP